MNPPRSADPQADFTTVFNGTGCNIIVSYAYSCLPWEISR